MHSRLLLILTAIVLAVIIGSIVYARQLYAPIVTFNTGRISPHMEARTDYQKYSSSCRQLENLLITAQGPVAKRPGTKYIATSTETADIVKLIPFVYSTDDSYVLEFTYNTTVDPNGVLYFYRNGGQIEAP